MMETKPAFKTTEFWGTAIAQLIGLAQLSGVWEYVGQSHNTQVLAVMSALTAGYAIARGVAKKGIPYDPNANVDTTTKV